MAKPPVKIEALDLGTGKPLSMVVKVEGNCPCGGTYQGGYVEDVPTVMHSLPPCQKYIDLVVTDFLVYVRESRSN